MFAKEMVKFMNADLEKALRDFVRNAYGDRPAYPWLAEDILEEMEEVVSDEVEMCRDIDPRMQESW